MGESTGDDTSVEEADVSYIVIQHPTKATRYAAEVDESGHILAAVGPLYDGQPVDEDSLASYLQNSNPIAASEDAEALERALRTA